MHKSTINYFKVGSFVLVGLGLIIFTLLILGSSSLFQPVVYVETYFEESIQGIADGTPVKYRGLQIGYIAEIAFTDEVYNDKNPTELKIYNRSIYVKIAITSKLFTRFSRERLIKFLTREVEQGLRVKLVTQGLTGTSYLEFDYVDPTTALPPVAISWQPHYFYVPAATSTLARLSENAQYIMNELATIDFTKLFSDFSLLINAMLQLITKLEYSVTPLTSGAATLFQNLTEVTANLRSITEQLKLNPASMVFGKPPPPLDLRKPCNRVK